MKNIIIFIFVVFAAWPWRVTADDWPQWRGPKRDGVWRESGILKKFPAGGLIRDIEAFRMGRDAVSLTGGSKGLKIRDVIVERVSLKRGYERGAVEVSDGASNIFVRDVYARDCLYAIDVQDHRGKSAPNRDIVIKNVTAVRCKHIIRTANSPRGHSGLLIGSGSLLFIFYIKVKSNDPLPVPLSGYILKRHGYLDPLPILNNFLIQFYNKIDNLLFNYILFIEGGK